MSDAFTKELELTPLSVETKTFNRRDGSGTFDKIEITAELPSAGKVWLKAFPEKAVGVAVGVPFWAIVKATPKTTGTGYFYDFEVAGTSSVTRIEQPKAAPVAQPPREMADADAIRTLHLFVAERLAQIETKIDALSSEKELDDLASGAVAKGF